MATETTWVAAVEQLPADSRGFRRVLRLHAVAVQAAGAAPRSACGYQHATDELRPDRAWGSVTISGRCALCEVSLRRQRNETLDVSDRAVLENEPGSRRLTVVPEDTGERRLDPRR